MSFRYPISISNFSAMLSINMLINRDTMSPVLNKPQGVVPDKHFCQIPFLIQLSFRSINCMINN